MSEKEYNNTFRFTLYQGNVLLCEKAFDADKFNPFTRYSINIRDILPRSITKLQKVLSKKNYDIVLECGSGMSYDLYHHYQGILNSYPSDVKSTMKYNPETIVNQIEEKTIRGVECKIGFYINDNTIVERVFYVDGFNPVARWSVDILDAVIEIADSIYDKIKGSDYRNMWDDYDLINMRGLSINQIRELSTPKREDMLRKLRRN